MKIINAIKKLAYDLYNSTKRFPVSIALAASAVILLMILNHNNQLFSKNTEDIITRIVMVLILGIPFSLCIKLFTERKKDSKATISIISYIILAIGMILYYLFLLKELKMVPITRYTAILFAACLAFFFVPYLFRRNGFEVYVIKLISRFFTTAIYSLILFLGISAILFTIDNLLGIYVDGKVYFDVWLGVVGFFCPSFFLGGVPLYEKEFDNSSYPKLLKILILYIVMPLVAAYTLILYIYFIKVIITFEWPSGMVGHLVLWYSVISALVIFLISPYRDENTWAKSFCFWLPKVILPLLILMFISVGIRVNAYGITENRYFVILLGLWAFGVMIYLNFSGFKRNIILPLSLSIIAILSVIGPWSSYSVSIMSQNSRFEGILSKYNMIQNDKIINSKVEVDEEDKKELSEIIRYFINSHEPKDLKLLPANFKTENMQEIFGFPYVEYNYFNQEFTFFSYMGNTGNEPFEITGFDYMFMTRGYEPSNVNINGGYEIVYDNSVHEVKILFDGNEIYKSSLLNYGTKIYEKFGVTEKYTLDYKETSIIDENDNVRVKYVLQSLNGSKHNITGEVNIEAIDVNMFIDFK